MNTDFPALGKTIEETLSKSHNQDLERLQIEINFPLLFFASILLHRDLVNGNFDQVLMASRDCFLWHNLQKKIRDFLRGNYTVSYFLTSRLARTKASNNYLKYTNDLLGVRPLVVELIASGTTLVPFVQKLNGPPPILLLARYLSGSQFSLKSLLPGVYDYSPLEATNPARHSMVADVTENGRPIYWDKEIVDWKNAEDIRVMHDAFNLALQTMQNYDFDKDLSAPTNVVLSQLIDCHSQLLCSLWVKDIEGRYEEEIKITDDLRKIQKG